MFQNLIVDRSAWLPSSYRVPPIQIGDEETLYTVVTCEAQVIVDRVCRHSDREHLSNHHTADYLEYSCSIVETHLIHQYCGMVNGSSLGPLTEKDHSDIKSCRNLYFFSLKNSFIDKVSNHCLESLFFLLLMYMLQIFFITRCTFIFKIIFPSR